MTSFVQKYATPLTTALSIVATVTGVMLFFHLGKATVTAMHEWLGMAFVLAIALHTVKHRIMLGKIVARPSARAIFGGVGVAAALFLAASAVVPAGGNPLKAIAERSMQAPLTDLAPVLGVLPGELVQRLRAAGFERASADQSAVQIATGAKSDPKRVLGVLVQ